MSKEWTVVCPKCTRTADFEGDTMQEAQDIAGIDGWVMSTDGALICPKCPGGGSVEKNPAVRGAMLMGIRSLRAMDEQVAAKARESAQVNPGDVLEYNYKGKVRQVIT